MNENSKLLVAAVAAEVHEVAPHGVILLDLLKTK
jgi:hypothetical protein